MFNVLQYMTESQVLVKVQQWQLNPAHNTLLSLSHPQSVSIIPAQSIYLL